MKSTILLLGTTLISFCLFSCQPKQTGENTNFDWLVGEWVRTNNEPNKTTFENWEQVNDTEYKGFSYTLENQDTTWQEHVRLIKIQDSWSFQVKGVGEPKATLFKVTAIETDRFVCENPANEFPKKIEYWKSDQNLEAKISGSGMEIPFKFKPK